MMNKNLFLLDVKKDKDKYIGTAWDSKKTAHKNITVVGKDITTGTFFVSGEFDKKSNQLIIKEKFEKIDTVYTHKTFEGNVSHGYFRTSDPVLSGIYKVIGLPPCPKYTRFEISGYIDHDTFIAYTFARSEKVEFKITKIKKTIPSIKMKLVEAEAKKYGKINVLMEDKDIVIDREYIAYGEIKNVNDIGIAFVPIRCFRIIEVEFEIKGGIRYDDDSYRLIADVNFIKHDNGETTPPTNKPKISGYLPVAFAGDIFRCAGYWKETRKGYWFYVIRGERIFPSEIKLIQNFLTTAVKGIGKKTAQKITDLFGANTINEIKADYKKLTKIKGINEKRAKEIYDGIMESSYMDKVFSFLMQNEVPFNDIITIYKKYRNAAIDKITENPYCICSIGIDFRVADKIAHNIGLKENDVRRIKQAIYMFLKEENENNGDLFTYEDYLMENLYDFTVRHGFYDYGTPFTRDEIINALNSFEYNEVIREKHLSNDRYCLYRKNLYNLEIDIVQRLKNIISEFKAPFCTKKQIDEFIKYYESTYKFKLAEKQKEAIHMALTKPISILTGGPGTGKTQTINAIIKCIKYINSEATIALCAPTGKASQRITEVTGMPAMTIHRKLKYMPYEDNVELEPITSDFVIIDESSMIDADLFCKLIYNIDEKTRILFVGDHEQLPSVGEGLILRDMINSGKIPVTKLTEIFRQAKDSQIITNSHKIIQGIDTETGLTIDNKKGDFCFIKRSTMSSISDKIIEVMERLLTSKVKKYKLNEIQVLTPTNNGVLGTYALNRRIQERFNPYKEDEIQFQCTVNKIFRKGDRVIQTENDYEMDVYNGTIGYVVDIIEENIPDDEGNPVYTMLVDFDGETKTYTKENSDKLMLAYSLSIHKSQGSEYPVVIIPIHNSFDILLNRNMLYTGITRAKETVILIGTKEALNYAINKTDNITRNSQIIERLSI